MDDKRVVIQLHYLFLKYIVHLHYIRYTNNVITNTNNVIRTVHTLYINGSTCNYKRSR